MLDTVTNTPTAAAGTSGPALTLCIIGAGISGLVAAKIMRGRGYAVTVLEKSGDIGGVWDPARSYPGVKTQTPRDLYAYTDFPMPRDYPEWPSGPQVHAYLDAYAARSDLRSLIRFGTEVLSVAKDGASGRWMVTTREAGGAPILTAYDIVLVATGQFSRQRKLEIAGEAAFTAAGGIVQHSSEHVDSSIARGRDVVVVGFSKSATDVAMNAVAEGAKSVTIVYREPSWKIPYFFGGLVNFKNILYCRASEAMFMPWAPSGVGRVMRALSAPAIWANWRALESLLNMQFGLKKLGLRPKGRIEDSIHCATSIETPGFYKAIKEGRIKAVKGELRAYGAHAVEVEGAGTVPADVVVLGIGWIQDFPFFDASVLDKIVTSDGQYQLYRLMVHPDLPGLGFVGFNSSFSTTLSAELGANWLARYFDGALVRQPSAAAMRSEMGRYHEWRTRDRKVAMSYGGLCVAPYHHFHFDLLMRDMGARTKDTNFVAAHLAPLSPAVYGKLLATAPAPTIVRKEIA